MQPNLVRTLFKLAFEKKTHKDNCTVLERPETHLQFADFGILDRARELFQASAGKNLMELVQECVVD